MSERLEDLIAREGERCVWCGNQPWRRDLTLEHLCPRSKGGTAEPENALVACKRCNKARRSTSASAFARDRAERALDPDMGRLRMALEGLAESERRAHRDYGTRELRHLDAAERNARLTRGL